MWDRNQAGSAAACPHGPSPRAAAADPALVALSVIPLHFLTAPLVGVIGSWEWELRDRSLEVFFVCVCGNVNSGGKGKGGLEGHLPLINFIGRGRNWMEVVLLIKKK